MTKDQGAETLDGSKPSLEKPWKQKRKLVRNGKASKEVEIFEGKPVAPSPSMVELTSAENGYIRIICMNECHFLVPLKVVDSFQCIDLILHSEVSFKERVENVIRFPDMSPEVMETVLRFVFTDHLHRLKAEKYWGAETPRLIFQFEVAPTLAMELIHAAHFLGVKHLLSVASTMVAHNLHDVPDLSFLPPDLAWCIAEQLSPQALFLAEERPDFLALNLDTESLWQRHCKSYLQESIVPVSVGSQYPPYDAWDAGHGPPPTSWKSLYMATYLQQLADGQNGGDTEKFMAEVLAKGQHAYCHTMRLTFWEWVVEGNANFFTKYMSSFKNILKLSLSKLPLDKLAGTDVSASLKFGAVLESLPLLQSLDISDAGIGADAAVCLSVGLKQHKRIQVLCLAYNTIETLGFSAIVQALPSVRTLKVLDVRENGIGAWVSLEVVEALQETALEELVLEGNFGALTKPRQSPVPPTSTSSGSMHDNNSGGSMEISIFEVSMRDLIMSGLPRQLKCLLCAKCELNDVRAKVLVKSLSTLSCIQKLDLSGNKVTSQGAIAVFLWLQDNVTLLELNLSNNYITDSCSIIMSRAISNHSSLEKLSLMENYTYGEANLHEVLNAAMERGIQLQAARSQNFTLDLRRTDIAHLTQARIQRQQNNYSCVNLLV